ncbi:MAG: PAS domain-containing sensor histidine kinase [Candidatus Lokiarchaeia archaeon]
MICLREELNIEKLIKLVEINLGKWKPEAVAIIDVNHKVWGEKGSVPRDYLDYFEKFSLLEMHEGDSLNNSCSFLMKVTEKTGIIVVMEDPYIARLSAINLRGRLNALSEFYNLEKFIKVKDEKSRFGEMLKTGDEMMDRALSDPLQVIASSLHLVKGKLKSLSSQSKSSPEYIKKKHEIDELLYIIEDQRKYMNKIVSDIHDYASPLKPKLIKTNLHQLIDDTLSKIPVPKNVDVKILIGRGFPQLMVDPEMMQRVFVNLIVNALQAMPHGGQLKIHGGQLKMPTKDAAFISIQDTGVGIPEEEIPEIFQPLPTTGAKGQGFGLPVCKRLVEAHGGTITVESKVGTGTTFTIKIPLP